LDLIIDTLLKKPEIIKNITAVTVQLSNGKPLKILRNHAPIIAQLSEHTLTYTKNKGNFFIAMLDGFIFVEKNKVLCVIEDLPKIEKTDD